MTHQASDAVADAGGAGAVAVDDGAWQDHPTSGYETCRWNDHDCGHNCDYDDDLCCLLYYFDGNLHGCDCHCCRPSNHKKNSAFVRV